MFITNISSLCKITNFIIVVSDTSISGFRFLRTNVKAVSSKSVRRSNKPRTKSDKNKS